MSHLRFDRLWHFIAGMEPLIALFWLGLIIFTSGLAVVMYTRWGQYKPLRKCMALSLLAHLVLASYAATVEITTPQPQLPEHYFHVTLTDDPAEQSSPGTADAAKSPGPVEGQETVAADQPWESFSSQPVTRPQTTDLPALELPKTVDEPKRSVRVESPNLTASPSLDGVALLKPQPIEPDQAVVDRRQAAAPSPTPETIEAPTAERREGPSTPVPSALALPAPPTTALPSERVRAASEGAPLALLEQPLPMLSPNEITAADSLSAEAVVPPHLLRVQPFDRVAAKATPAPLGPAADDDPSYRPGVNSSGNEAAKPGTPPTSAGQTAKASAGANAGGGGVSLLASARPLGEVKKALPDAYRLRVAPNKQSVVETRGGTAETEAAVKAALKWLADNQAADGRWDPRVHGAGKETKVLGRDRQGAGSRADTGMTGLALLAFLAAGHTHLDGPYQNEVRRALEFLLRTQAADGNLGGQAATFEFMYCHAMATCALSEAYGMTRDSRLLQPLRRAIDYTVRAQDSAGGGWRYRPGDAGDTSQLGWQLMALKSAELAGIPIPVTTRNGIIRYLQSVSSGTYGGWASYRPKEKVSRSMTAEAMVCWQFLGLPRQHPACNEAGDLLLGELPGSGEYNLYYWYYSTLAMYQLQGDYWRRWNEALRPAILGRQIKTGPLSGSWDTSEVWGAYGGRVYTTALATLTLEVYYRFLPLYSAGSRDAQGH